jgi:malate dehydrogenase (oxaloacetate-decarboxylating)(NADP+)
MPISIGKLSLYVAGAGIRPSSTIPICLDLGTNTQKFLDDPLYVGLRQKRVPRAEMDELMDEFMHEMSVAFPKLLIQFEVNPKLLSIQYFCIELIYPIGLFH